jgi:hypothetical protein
MNITTIVIYVVLAVLVVAYLMKRKARASSEEMD